MNMTICSLVGVGAAAGASFGQCSSTVSLWESFRAGQATVGGARQTAGDAFTFRRDGVNGVLLTSVRNADIYPFA